MDRLIERADNIRKLIRESESVSDENLIAMSKLKIAILEARTDPALGVGTGQTALMRLSQAEGQVMSASSNLFRVHAELSSIAQTTGRFDEEYPTVILDSVVDQVQPTRKREEVI